MEMKNLLICFCFFFILVSERIQPMQARFVKMCHFHVVILSFYFQWSKHMDLCISDDLFPYKSETDFSKAITSLPVRSPKGRCFRYPSYCQTTCSFWCNYWGNYQHSQWSWTGLCSQGLSAGDNTGEKYCRLRPAVCLGEGSRGLPLIEENKRMCRIWDKRTGKGRGLGQG